jgi:hypothetical protein
MRGDLSLIKTPGRTPAYKGTEDRKILWLFYRRDILSIVGISRCYRRAKYFSIGGPYLVYRHGTSHSIVGMHLFYRRSKSFSIVETHPSNTTEVAQITNLINSLRVSPDVIEAYLCIIFYYSILGL